MDKVYLKNYTVIAKHGYYKEEHEKSQRFVVSVTATCDTRNAGKEDNLHKTINYEDIRKCVHEVLTKSSHNLIESLAEEIGELILAHTSIISVEIDIQKPDVWADCVPGVSIIRSRR